MSSKCGDIIEYQSGTKTHQYTFKFLTNPYSLEWSSKASKSIVAKQTRQTVVSASVPHWWKFYPHHANRGNVQTNLGRLPLVLAALQPSHDDTLLRIWLAAGNPNAI